jgi:hypothetical protein
MSVSLFIGYRDARREDRLVPIASEDIFQRHWQPISSELRLRWVPRFYSGWMLSNGDIPHILEELVRLQHHLTGGPAHAEISAHMLARISVLSRELNEVLRTLDADIFIGSPLEAQRRSAAFYRADYVRESTLRRRPARPAISNAAEADAAKLSDRLRSTIQIFFADSPANSR